MNISEVTVRKERVNFYDFGLSSWADFAYVRNPRTLNTERFDRLIALMEKIQLREEERTADRLEDEQSFFYLGTWVSLDHAFEDNLFKEDDSVDDRIDVLHKCGTSCCAMGWAAMDPANNKEGLRASVTGVPVFGMSQGIEAAMDFYGLGRFTASSLFLPDHYPADGEEDVPIDKVLARLRMVRAGEPVPYCLDKDSYLGPDTHDDPEDDED